MGHVETFKKYTPLAVTYAKRDLNMCLSFGYSKEDIVSWALEALWIACLKKQDTLEEPQFMKYLAVRIHGEIVDIVRKDKINFGTKASGIKMPCFSQLTDFSNSGEDFKLLDPLNGLEIKKSYSSEYNDLDIVLDEELFIHVTVGMNAREKFIVRRKFFEGYKMVEIATELGISAGLVSWTYTNKIIPKLKSRLELAA